MAQGRGLEKDHSLPGDPASPRGTRLLPAGPSLQPERGTHGRSMPGWPKAEMDTEKVNMNSSTVDPLMALKTTVVQAQLRGCKMSELLSTEQRTLPKGLSSACPTPCAGHCRANQRCTDHRPGQRGCSGVPPAAHQLARTLQKPSNTLAAALLLHGRRGPDVMEQHPRKCHGEN